MSEHRAAPDLPPANVLWGRVATAIVVVLLAFGLGRCTAEGGVPEEDVAALEAEVEQLQATNDQLQGEVDRLTQAADAPDPAAPAEPTDAPTTEPTTPPAPVEGEPGGTWTVGPGDTLQAIALDVYGDRAKAQQIAAINGIETSTTLQVGQVLQLPPAG